MSKGAAKERELVTGDSLLLLASNKKSVKALLTLASELDINAANKFGRTALHHHVQRDDLGSVLTLCAFGAEMNAQDNDGNSALHLAVMRGNITIVKALLILGANINTSNIAGDTPLHLAAIVVHQNKQDVIRCLVTCGAQRCLKSKEGCTIQCGFRESGAPPPSPSPHGNRLINNMPPFRFGLNQFVQNQCIANIEQLCKTKVDTKDQNVSYETVLSLDGGGIRGLVMVQILLALERELGDSLINYVGWLGGTSTGALLAAALASGKSLRDCQHMYLQFKDDIFDDRWTRPYDTNVLRKFLQRVFGENTTMADVTKAKLIITAAIADEIPIKLKLFRNYQLPLSSDDNAEMGYAGLKEQWLWHALRCSSAAPTYFESVNDRFLDGGIICNNPTVEILSEIQTFNNASAFVGRAEKLRVGCCLSVGTGRMPPVAAGSLSFRGFGCRSSQFAVMMLNLLKEQISESDGVPVDRSRALTQQSGAPFFRLSPQLSKEYRMDTKDDVEIVEMLWETENYVREIEEEIKRLAQVIKMIKETK